MLRVRKASRFILRRGVAAPMIPMVLVPGLREFVACMRDPRLYPEWPMMTCVQPFVEEVLDP